MRCPSCNKFVGYEEVEPEMEFSIDADGHVIGSVRIVNACQECGEELKEAVFDIDFAPKIDEKHKDHAFGVELNDIERTCRSEGKRRGTKTFYGAKVEIVVTCDDCEGGPVVASLSWSDDEQASSMDELC